MNKVTIMEDWIASLQNDPNIGSSINETAVAYILYGLYKYGVSGEKIDLGAVFGQNAGVLNFALLSLYPQIDRIQKFSKGEHKGGKYDNDAIKELAIKGFGPKAICQQLGYDVTVAKSISTNRYYKEGKEIFKKNKDAVSAFDF